MESDSVHDPLPDELTDRELLERFQRGEQLAATALYFRYAPRLFALAQSRCSPALANRLDADDIVQSVFTRFFRRARSGDYQLPMGAELWKLLLVIALNRIRTAEAYHRAGKRDVGATATSAGLEESLDAGRRCHNGGDAHLHLVIHEALERLSAPLRETIELRLQGYEIREIAELTGRPRRTVERLLQEARAELRGALEGTV